MPRPKSKNELLELGDKNFNKLMEYIATFSPEEQMTEFPKGTLNRNIRDVLMHLYEWHLMLLQWYKVGLTDKKPDIPAKGYTWKTLPALNKLIRDKYQDTDLATAKKLLKSSTKKLRKLIEQHSEEELFEKKRFKWTGSTSLAAYLISNTSSHYDWAYKLIRKVKR